MYLSANGPIYIQGIDIAVILAIYTVHKDRHVMMHA